MTSQARGRCRAGIIAAGWGDRLRAGAATLKPLVRVGGQPLVDRVLTSLAEASPSEVVVILNEASLAVKDHVLSRQWPFALRWIVETTPSSMYSFLRLVETLAGDGDPGPFLVSTVDTIAAPGAFGRFQAAAARLDADLVLAVAEPTDDDRPLFVRLGADGVRVDAIGVSAESGVAASGPDELLATAGYYSVRAGVLAEAADARRAGLPALRAFFGRLVDAGYQVAAVRVTGGVDVDKPADVGAAEAFLRQVEV